MLILTHSRRQAIDSHHSDPRLARSGSIGQFCVAQNLATQSSVLNNPHLSSPLAPFPTIMCSRAHLTPPYHPLSITFHLALLRPATHMSLPPYPIAFFLNGIFASDLDGWGTPIKVNRINNLYYHYQDARDYSSLREVGSAGSLKHPPNPIIVSCGTARRSIPATCDLTRCRRCTESETAFQLLPSERCVSPHLAGRLSAVFHYSCRQHDPPGAFCMAIPVACAHLRSLWCPLLPA